MSTVEKIRDRLKDGLSASRVKIQDLSEAHRGHPGATGGGGHYRVQVVSIAFEGMTQVQRHRSVYEALDGLMGNEIHALSIDARTPEESQDRS